MLSFSFLNIIWKYLRGVIAFKAISMAMSSMIAELLVTFPFAKEKAVHGDDNSRRRPNANIGLKGIQRHVTSCDLDSERDSFFDCQAWRPSDSQEDFHTGDSFFDCQAGRPSDSQEDFHTPNGDQSPVEGGEGGKKKFFQFFKDGYWDDELVHNRKVITVYKEIKLVRFIPELSPAHHVARHKPRYICGKLPDESRENDNIFNKNRKENMGKASSCFKFPSVSLTASWLALKGRKKLTALNGN